jgi:hypothetical protein
VFRRVAVTKSEQDGGCQPVRSHNRHAFAAVDIDEMVYRYQDIVFGKQGGTVYGSEANAPTSGARTQ